MKKLVYYILFYIFFSLVQFIFGRYIGIFGVFPNFILLAVVYLGISKRTICAQLLGFLFGLSWDVFSTDIFGIRAVMFTVAGYLSGKIFKNFDVDKVFSQFVIVFFVNIVYWLGFGLIHFIVLGSGGWISLLDCAKIAVTILFAPVVFRFLNKVNKILRM